MIRADQHAKQNEAAPPAHVELSAIERARAYGIDISLLHYMLERPVIERLRFLDEVLAFDRLMQRQSRHVCQ